MFTLSQTQLTTLSGNKDQKAHIQEVPFGNEFNHVPAISFASVILLLVTARTRIMKKKYQY